MAGISSFSFNERQMLSFFNVPQNKHRLLQLEISNLVKKDENKFDKHLLIKHLINLYIVDKI